MQKQTEKYYDGDAYLRRFTSAVVSCAPDGERFAAVLEGTAFYPEGGGQPADHGTLGGANVLDVHERGGVIVHTVDRPLAPGAKVEGAVDWKRRFDHMQQHTGEHIVSGIVRALHGLDNVGFHMGADAVTVDFGGPLSAEDLRGIERRANEAVYADLPVEARYPGKNELDAADYRSKKELSGAVRLVTIPGIDVCACCGTHVRTTGQVGIIRLFAAQKYKGGTRVTMLSGGRARAELAARDDILAAAGALLSVKPRETAQAVERLLADAARLKQHLNAAQDALFAQRARATPYAEGNLCVIEEDFAPDALRRLCLALCERCSGAAAVFSGNDAAGYRYAVGSKSLDMRALGKEMNAALAGRGGGSRELIQGSAACGRGEIERFFAG